MASDLDPAPATDLLDEINAACEKARHVCQQYRFSRDVMFDGMRAQGYSIFAIDEPGCGETWVVDDRLFALLKEKMTLTEFMPGGMPTGVQLITASTHRENEFTRPMSHTEMRDAFTKLREKYESPNPFGK